MPVSAAQQRQLWPRELGLTDFSGGWNNRDAPTELATNESPDLLNVTLDERGGVQKRLGFVTDNASPFGGGLVSNTFKWRSGGHKLTQAGRSVYRDADTTARLTFSTTDRAFFADFAGKAWAIHPVDGLYASTDGITWNAQSGSPKGSFLIVSKNRLVAGGDPANKATLYGSAIGDGTDWSTDEGHGWTNQIREVNDAVLVAAAAVGGEDVLGRPGFLLFKNDSFYRVYDSDTGAYTTMDATVGCASALAAVGVRGQVVFVSTQGIFVSTGSTSGSTAPKEASAKVSRLFQPDQIAFDKANLFAAGGKGDRVHISLPTAGAAANDLHLEYHPAQGWIVKGTDAMSCYATDLDEVEKLYGGSPTATGQVYQLGLGGTDDGAPITCRYQTKWLAPASGIKCRFRSVRVFGRGLFDLYTKRDFDTGDGDLTPVALPGGALIWDEGDWDVSEWGPANYEDSSDFWSLGQGTHVSFVFRETSSISASGPPLLDGGAAPEVGSFAVYGLNLMFVPIGA